MSKLSNPSRTDLRNKIEVDKMSMGKLGTIFGKGNNAITNIIGLILILLVIVMFIFSFIHPNEALDYWKLIAPIITLALGYLAGKDKLK